jgi:RNA polymerase sigma-70 factor (ECF subfamily)
MPELEKNLQAHVSDRLVADSGVLKRYVNRHAADAHDAADIYQESILRVMEQARASVIRNPVAYAIRIARNLIINQPKHYSVDTAYLDTLICPARSPEESLSYDQRVKALKVFLASMPIMRREVFLRRRMRGESRAHISAALNLSEDAVKKHITRALSDLQRFLDETN